MARKKPKIVLLEWDDSCMGSRVWTETSDPPLTPSACTSVGFVVEENAKFTTLAMGVSGDGQHTCFTIPKSAIRRVRRLDK